MCARTSQNKENGCVFPSYPYLEVKGQLDADQFADRIPNPDMEVVNEIAEKLGLTFVFDKETESNVCFINSPEIRDDYKSTFTTTDILDYFYAVLQTPAYSRYLNSRNFDFSHIPHPNDPDVFWKCVRLGGQLRELHTLESSKKGNFNTRFPIEGDNIITRDLTDKNKVYDPIDKSKGKVWINDKQYFDTVPLVAWDFYVGGYQPVREWLKVRKGRTLTSDDIRHFQKFVVLITETDILIRKITEITAE